MISPDQQSSLYWPLSQLCKLLHQEQKISVESRASLHLTPSSATPRLRSSSTPHGSLLSASHTCSSFHSRTSFPSAPPPRPHLVPLLALPPQNSSRLWWGVSSSKNPSFPECPDDVMSPSSWSCGEKPQWEWENQAAGEGSHPKCLLFKLDQSL